MEFRGLVFLGPLNSFLLCLFMSLIGPLETAQEKKIKINKNDKRKKTIFFMVSYFG